MMGISVDAQLPGGSLSAIQPNPLKRVAMTTFESVVKPVAEEAEPAYNAWKEQRKVTNDVNEEEGEAIKKPARKRKKATDSDAESRGRVFRKKIPQKTQTLLDRALGKTLYVIDRSRVGTEDCPEEIVDLAGSTGNIYTIHIKKQPTCTCMAYQHTISPKTGLGDECKHILYVLNRVLKAPPHLQYQLALLSSELREIFENAPPILTGSPSSSPSGSSSNRKPVEDDCPICCCPFETDSDEMTADEIVWCKAACGNNVHKSCFEQWAATKKVANYGSAAQVTCPFCRSLWQGDEDSLKKIAKCGEKNEEGYVNVAEELGISQERDLSTYHQPWVRQQQKAGNLSRRYY